MQAACLILGAGQDGGTPQVGERHGVGPDRSASSIVVRSPAGSIVLLDASPDFRPQAARLVRWYHYPPDRSRVVDAVVVTHAHMGHYAGLLHFGTEVSDTQGVRLLATPGFQSFIAANEPWSTLITRGNLLPETLAPSATVDASLEIVGIAVPHRAEYTDTIAVSVLSKGRPWLLYVPDIDGWEGWPRAAEVIAEHDIALLDATFSSVEELTNRDFAQVRHPLVPDTIDRFADLTDSTRIVLTHMNHTNPLADAGSTIAAKARAAGFEVAMDGMELAP
ncbi:MAG: MBL fold metallo-hydrolase [Acidimicrobiia bacterium]